MFLHKYPNKSKILVLVMDIIEILNVISGRPQKLHSFYLAFFEKNGPPKSCTLFIWLFLTKVGLNGCSFIPFSLLFFSIMLTKQEKLSCQHNFLSFLFSSSVSKRSVSSHLLSYTISKKFLDSHLVSLFLSLRRTSLSSLDQFIT